MKQFAGLSSHSRHDLQDMSPFLGRKSYLPAIGRYSQGVDHTCPIEFPVLAGFEVWMMEGFLPENEGSK